MTLTPDQSRMTPRVTALMLEHAADAYRRGLLHKAYELEHHVLCHADYVPCIGEACRAPVDEAQLALYRATRRATVAR